MAYKYPNLPSSQSYKEEKADFWEIESIRHPGQYVAQNHILKTIGIEFDEIDNDGIRSEEDNLNEILEEVFIELNQRTNNSNNNYPFSFGTYSIKANDLNNEIDYLYVYCLLCTRFNMKTEKIQNNIDGTLLFEKICARVAENYFGTNAKAIVFGTSSSGGFSGKVKDLIRQLGEGQNFVDPNYSPTSKNDDSVDIVVWKEFADKKMGKLIGFGQCKTGTSSWRNDIKKLRPDHFCNTWFSKSPILEPIPLVFLTDTMNEKYDDYASQKGYLVFNRFRIMEYAIGYLDDSLNDSIKKWVDGALTKIDQKS